VAVRAYDLALLDLRQNAPPVSIGQGVADVERLRIAIEMIELEHHRIVLSAVGAGMEREVTQ
jgi:hypothetical protein